MNESAILTALRSRNQQTIQQVYRKYFPMILQLVVNNNGTEEEAKDIYQESFILFFEKLQEDLILTCTIKTFLYSICRRQWLKKLYEKNKFAAGLKDKETFISIEDDIQEAEEREKDFSNMEASLNKLGEPCRTLLTDFYIENKRMEELAEKFGYTNADNAKNQKYKCLQRLKKLFFENN